MDSPPHSQRPTKRLPSSLEVHVDTQRKQPRPLRARNLLLNWPETAGEIWIKEVWYEVPQLTRPVFMGGQPVGW